MNNDALVAALGPDTVAAVHGYRLAVIRQAECRGLTLASEPLSGVMQLAGGCVVVDPVDIRLTIRATSRHALTGWALRWCPAEGWSLAASRLDPPARYLAGPGATPLQLVPTAADVVDWTCAQPAGSTEPPTGVEFDDDVTAIDRLLRFVDRQHPMSLHQAYCPMPASTEGDHHEPTELSTRAVEPRKAPCP